MIVSNDMAARKCTVNVNSDNMIVSEERIIQDFPFSNIQVVSSSIEEFKVLLDTHELTADQVVRCKDVRRREKNKVAVQNFRKRKLNLVVELKEKIRRSEAVGEAVKAAL